MVEYHGWAVVLSSAKENGEKDLDEIVRNLSELLKEMNCDNRQVELNSSNGMYCIFTQGSANRVSKDVQKIFDLFEWLKEHALGSYGLLYFRDDEDSSLENGFKVGVLRRGGFSFRNDPFLSPCIPVIEDE